MGLPVAVTARVAPGQSPAVRHVVRDVLLLLTVVAIVTTVSRGLQTRVPDDRLTLILALFVAVAGGAAALLGVLVARLDAESRIGWLSLMLACYSLLAIPTTMIVTLDNAPAPAVGGVRLLVHCVVVASLLLALVGTAPPAGWHTAHALLGGAGLIAAAGGFGLAFPTTIEAVTSSQQVRFVVALTWGGLAAAIAGLAVKRRAWAMWHVGVGLALLGFVDAGHAVSNVSPAAELGLVFSSISLLAVGLVLSGTVCLAGQALDRLADERAAHEEELRLAEIRLARTAERDHELRNGLAGLAGATSLMRADHADPRLTNAVASELSRLDELLRSPGGCRSQSRRSDYAVGPVLDGLAALRVATGMDVRLDVEPGLRAVGSSDLLAQVLTNVVANAARHAAGSPVHLDACRDGDDIVIHVRDAGPGVPPGHEQAVFERGVRSERAGGAGLGLNICRRLLEGAGGSIEIAPSTPASAGCTVVVRLPAAPSSHPPVPARAWRCAS